MPMSKRKFLVGAIAGLWLAGSSVGTAGAQTVDGSLRGADKFNLLIGDLDKNSAACGITGPGLTKAANKGVKRAPFTLGGEEYDLYVQVTSMRKDGECFSSVAVQAYYYGEITLPAYPEGNNAEVMLWKDGKLAITAERAHGANVSKLVTQLIQKLVADWKKDNS